jgi:hypothetical protein
MRYLAKDIPNNCQSVTFDYRGSDIWSNDMIKLTRMKKIDTKDRKIWYIYQILVSFQSYSTFSTKFIGDFRHPVDHNYLPSSSRTIASMLFPLVSGRKMTTKRPPEKQIVAYIKRQPCIPIIAIK